MIYSTVVEVHTSDSDVIVQSCPVEIFTNESNNENDERVYIFDTPILMIKNYVIQEE